MESRVDGANEAKWRPRVSMTPMKRNGDPYQLACMVTRGRRLRDENKMFQRVGHILDKAQVNGVNGRIMTRKIPASKAPKKGTPQATDTAIRCFIRFRTVTGDDKDRSREGLVTIWFGLFGGRIVLGGVSNERNPGRLG